MTFDLGIKSSAANALASRSSRWTPVGSDAWLRLLAHGGGEDLLIDQAGEPDAGRSACWVSATVARHR